MAETVLLRTALTSARIDVVEALEQCLGEARAHSQTAVAVVMVGEDGDIRTATTFSSRLMLKGALLHALSRIDSE
ncbi:hypothetical protein [Paracoccus sanguinis]|uniref:Heme-binding protein n=1 Tax=Paracoccus sanguinis TaxID=1545044 RepID=A0A1H2SSQ9_9RHOB|nr:hypothetical protein [Paracoccus sanguinis]KGJ19302.1 hypothetical protein IX57_00095 [Paracoccus sanguinis]SDW34495.1 hypothetical protein SAMN05444276_101715 [Paracoccus sanguinis]